jgi:hypothetical protein
MNAEERALRAIEITRSILERALNDPPVLVQLFSLKTNPEALEDWITSVLEYLDKTKEEER